MLNDTKIVLKKISEFPYQHISQDVVHKCILVVKLQGDDKKSCAFVLSTTTVFLHFEFINDSPYIKVHDKEA